jgi:hypothetical protein
MQRWWNVGALAIAIGAASFGVHQCAADGDASVEEGTHQRARSGSSTSAPWSARTRAAVALGDGGVSGDASLEPEARPYCYLGVAVDERGRPVPGADVLATEVLDGVTRQVGETRTASDGGFEVCIGDHDAIVEVFGADGGWGRCSISSGGEILRVEVAREARLAGRVLDPAGRPVAAAGIYVGYFLPGRDDRVHVNEDNLALTGALEWRTDAEGRFELPVVSGILAAIEIDADGYALESRGPFGMTPGASHEVEVRLREAASVSGRVLGEGRPIAGAALYLYGEDYDGQREASTDEQGRFRWDGLTDERFTLRVVAPGWVSEERYEIAPGEHDISLERGARLEVRVHAGASARGCIRFDDVDVFVGDRFPPDGRSVDEAGVVHATFNALPAGTLPIAAVVHRTGIRTVHPISLVGGQDAVVDLTLEAPPNSVRLRVEGLEAGTLAMLTGSLDVGGAEDPMEDWSYVVVAGTDLCTELPGGRYHLQLFADDFGEGVATETMELTGGSLTRWTPVFRRAERAPPARRRVEDRPVLCTADVELVFYDGATRVARSGPAEQRALPGDVVLRMDAVRAEDSEESFYLLRERLHGGEGSTLDMEVERDGARLHLRVPRDRYCE